MTLPLLGKAKKAVQAKQAARNGDAWLAEAKTEDGEWKDLKGWKEQYEPKPNPTKAQSIVRDKVKSKAVDSIFRKMQVGISKTITKTVSEVASAFLTKVYQEDPSKKANANATARVLPSINAIILSYRFETKSNKRQLAYIRKQACLDLFDALQPIVKKAHGATALSAEIRELVILHKSHIRGIAQDKVRNMMGLVQVKMDAQLVAVESRAQGVKDKAEMRLEAAHELGLASLDGSAAKKKLPDKELVMAKKNDIVAQFGTMLETMMVAKMEAMDEHISAMIDQFLTNLALVVKLFLDASHVGSGEAKDKEDFLKQLLKATQQQFDSFEASIQQEVDKVVAMMKAFVDEKDEEDENEHE